MWYMNEERELLQKSFRDFARKRVRPLAQKMEDGDASSREARTLPAKEARVICADTAFLDEAGSGEEFLGFEPAPETGNDITRARVLVSAGRGAASDTAWDAVQKLSKRLGGSVAWSRSFIDTGRVRDESCMIGTSGKSVRPEVLINAGISGAAQYTCGIARSRLVISINKDPRAKIFEHSDYGVVGDVDKILPALLEKL